MVDATQLAAVRRLARDVAGPPDAALRAAGQAVLVSAEAAASGPAVTAYAQGRRLAVARGDDPRLRAFLDFWIGRAGR